MARRQIHILDVTDIPCADYDTAALGVVLYGLYRLFNLVDESAVVSRPRTPLIAVDMPEIAVGISPLVPYRHLVVMEILHVGVTLKKPQKLVDDALEMHLLGGQQREAF